MLLDFINDAITKVLEKRMDQFVEDVKKELTDQGHVLTGKLRDSIRYEIRSLPNLIQAVVWMEDYGFTIDKGLKPSEVPYNPGSGAAESDYIQGLFTFWKLKGLGSEEALNAAFATANKHLQEGMPTENSFNFSNNGRRTGFFSNKVDDLEAEIEMLNSDVQSEVSIAITNSIQRTVSNFENIVLNI